MHVHGFGNSCTGKYSIRLLSSRRDVPVDSEANFIMCDGVGVGIDTISLVLFRQSKWRSQR